jgi:hypothetical protein
MEARYSLHSSDANLGMVKNMDFAFQLEGISATQQNIAF